MIAHLLHYLGIDTATGPFYAFWSGFGSDLTYLGVFWALARRHNCHEPRCLRIGRFPVTGTSWRVCKHHHPSPPGRGIRQRHHLYAGERVGDG